MYSITQSPSLALELAHGIEEEHFRKARSTRRRTRRLSAQPDGKRQWAPPRPWNPRPAVAV
jgi:hypothetical protein